MTPTSAPAPAPARIHTRTQSARITGIDLDELARLRESGVDHDGNPVQPFTDDEGDWPMRCCLTDSRVGDRLAIVNWSPFPWHGAYRAAGPIVIHADRCPSVPDGSLPEPFEQRRQILRGYGHHHRIVYRLGRLVEPGTGLLAAIEEMLADPEVDFVQSHNVLAGCYSFTARRA
ncbi:DUF1203 domain-containing protein [Nakamurella lactea]|uniref:DUF1203 domain-containing protein n=1 Tax=Nakamurella lactea TaxID=459515 RepID=UPI001377B5E8|nr:DUF1203 domain-containing protein [Nakamurella lactea]